MSVSTGGTTGGAWDPDTPTVDPVVVGELVTTDDDSSTFRWLWDRGLAMYATGIVIIVSAIVFEVLSADTAPEWLTYLTGVAGAAIFVRAAGRAGPTE